MYVIRLESDKAKTCWETLEIVSGQLPTRTIPRRVGITELSQIEHRPILGRRAINCDRPRHSSTVLLICSFADWRRTVVTEQWRWCMHSAHTVPWRHLQERWLAVWLFRPWYFTDDKSAKTCSWFWLEQKDAGGRACTDRFSYQITVPEFVRRRCESSLLVLMSGVTCS